MTDALKSVALSSQIGVESGVAPAEPARIAASVLTGAYSNAVPDPSIAVRASIGAARHQLTAVHASIGARRSAAADDRMTIAALFRVAHDASRNAVFPCHP